MYYAFSSLSFFSVFCKGSHTEKNTKNNQLDFQYFERKTLRGLTIPIFSHKKDDDFREKKENAGRLVEERRNTVKEAERHGDDDNEGEEREDSNRRKKRVRKEGRKEGILEGRRIHRGIAGSSRAR